MPEAASPSSAPRVILAFDYGLRRIGIACGDTVSRSARALKAILVDAGGVRWQEIDRLLREWQPSLAVVGLPYNVDGSDSSSTTGARQFAAELGARYHIAVDLVDERYSSLDAQARLKSQRESGARRRRVEKADIDAAAACVILERWFTEKN